MSIDAKADRGYGVSLSVSIGRRRLRAGLTTDEIWELAQVLAEAALEAEQIEEARRRIREEPWL